MKPDPNMKSSSPYIQPQSPQISNNITNNSNNPHYHQQPQNINGKQNSKTNVKPNLNIKSITKTTLEHINFT